MAGTVMILDDILENGGLSGMDEDGSFTMHYRWRNHNHPTAGGEDPGDFYWATRRWEPMGDSATLAWQSRCYHMYSQQGCA